MPDTFAGTWQAHVVRMQPHVVDRFFPFDALWYERIASDAYAWDPRRPELKQDVAFFPLWPLVLAGLRAALGDAGRARWGAVALAACFGFGSVWAFAALAWRVLGPRAARGAVWLFALWPGASFLLLSYPTGLMNLLACLAVLALLRGRYWWAALASGVLTASGPLGLGTAMAVMARAAAAWGWRRAPALAALGALAISGLLAFLALQWVKFGDPLAFVPAQGAWAAPVPALARLPRALAQLAVLPDFVQALRFVLRAAHGADLMQVQAGLESALHCAALALALLMLLVCVRVAPWPVVLQGGFTLALFVWFHSAVRPGNSTLRLTYCVLTTSIGLGWVLRDRAGLRRAAIAGFAALVAGAAFLSAYGYHVV